MIAIVIAIVIVLIPGGGGGMTDRVAVVKRDQKENQNALKRKVLKNLKEDLKNLKNLKKNLNLKEDKLMVIKIPIEGNLKMNIKDDLADAYLQGFIIEK